MKNIIIEAKFIVNKATLEEVFVLPFETGIADSKEIVVKFIKGYYETANILELDTTVSSEDAETILRSYARGYTTPGGVVDWDVQPGCTN
jgi:hypothetical protein